MDKALLVQFTEQNGVGWMLLLKYFSYHYLFNVSKSFPLWVFDKEEFREQIEREIDLCVLLRSPNIVYGRLSHPN